MYNDELTLTTLRIVFEYLYNKCGTKLYEDDFDVEGGYAFKSHQYTTDGCFVLRVTNIKPDGSIDSENDRKFVNDEKLIQELSNFAIKEDDVLIVMVGGSLGKVGLVSKEVLPALLNQNLWKVRFDSDFSSRYIYYLSLYLNNFKAIIKTSTHGHFSRKKYRELEIPAISKEESFRVSAYFDTIFANKKIPTTEFFNGCSQQLKALFSKEQSIIRVSTELDHQLALVKELRQAYLREAMQGKLVPPDPTDEPAEILLEKIKSEKEKLIAEKRIKRDKPLLPINPEELLFEIPSNWVWCRLGNLAEMCLGKMLDQVKNKGELQPYLRNVNVRWGSFDLSDLKEMRFTPDEDEKYSAYFGDLIICEGGEPGRAAIWKGDQPIKIQKAVHRVRTNKRALQSEYLYYCLLCDANSKRLTNYFTGGGIQHLTGRALSKYAIPLPPLNEQERIVAKLEKLMKFCDELEANIKQGIENADRLLQVALKEALESSN